MRPNYVRRWEDIEILPGALQALARLTAGGLDLIVLTNQSAIGRGLVSRETVDGINRLASYRVIAGYPLVITIGVAEHEIFADYERRRMIYLSVVAVLTLLVLIADADQRA